METYEKYNKWYVISVHVVMIATIDNWFGFAL